MFVSGVDASLKGPEYPQTGHMNDSLRQFVSLYPKSRRLGWVNSLFPFRQARVNAVIIFSPA
jgi:hypothetical protein